MTDINERDLENWLEYCHEELGFALSSSEKEFTANYILDKIKEDCEICKEDNDPDRILDLRPFI